MSLMKNKLELVRLVFQKIQAITSQTENAHNKYVYSALKYNKLCLQSIKIQKSIQ